MRTLLRWLRRSGVGASEESRLEAEHAVAAASTGASRSRAVIRRLTRLNVVCPLILAAAGLWVTYQWRLFEEDDAFIYCRYAENLAAGHGYVYNVGEKVNACSSFFIPYLLLLAYPLGLRVPVFLHWFCGLCLTAASVSAYYLFAAEKRCATGLFVGLLILLYTWVTYCFGMETFLLLALALGSVAASRYGKRTLSAALLGIAVAVRAPEGALLAVIMGVAYYAREKRLPKRAEVAAFAIPIAAWLALCCYHFGTPIPQSFAAKRLAAMFRVGFSEAPLSLPRQLIAVARGSISHALRTNPVLWALPPLAVLGLWQIRRYPHVMICVLWGVAVLAFYMVAAIRPFFWYLCPLWVAGILLAATGVDLVRPRPLRALVALAVLSTQLVANAAEARICLTRNWRLAVYPQVAQYLREHAHPHDTVALEEIGVMGYYSGLRVLDLQGLVTPRMVDQRVHGRFSAWLHEERPGYFILWSPGQNVGSDAAVESIYGSLIEFRDGYHVARTFTSPYGHSFDLYARVPEDAYAASVTALQRTRTAALSRLDPEEFPHWRFAEPQDVAGWTRNSVEILGGLEYEEGLSLESTGIDPQLRIKLPKPIPIAAVQAVVVRMLTHPDPHRAREFGQLFFTTSASPAFTPSHMMVFQLIRDGRFHTYSLRISRLHAAASDAELLELRLDPRSGPGRFALASVELAPFTADVNCDIEFP